MVKTTTLRGLVYSKYKNTTDFALAIGWSRNRVSRVLNGVQELTEDDIIALAKVLDIKNERDFMHIFFPELSTEWTA